MPRLLLAASLVLVAPGLLAGCSDGSSATPEAAPAAAGGELQVVGAVTPTPPNPAVATVWMEVVNDSGRDDVLLAVETPVAERAQVHRTTDDGGRSVMAEVDRLDVPAGSTVTFDATGLHVMLSGVTEPLADGTSFELTLTFEHAGEVSATVDVVDALDLAAGDGDHDDHSATEEER